MSILKTFRKWGLHLQTKRLERKYRDRPYAEFYRALMEARTAYDPKYAVGGRWEEIGRLQFDFLLASGLKPHHRLLDFGCGSLRGGLRFINYLDAGHYTGVDISADILDAGRGFLDAAGLKAKNPNLFQVSDLSFDDYDGATYDFIIAQSVLTHMPEEDVDRLFANIGKVMHAGTTFFATYFDGRGEYFLSMDRSNVHYPLAMLVEMGARHGLKATHDPSYVHPRDQQMLRIHVAEAKDRT